MEKVEIRNLKEKFSKLHFLVVGDMALDINTIGVYSGQSREIEGLPVFRYSKVEYNPGGGANLAMNLRELGVEVLVCGTWGKGLYSSSNGEPNFILDVDWNRKILQTFFQKEFIHFEGMVEGLRTPVFGKYFFPVGHHHLRIDSDSVELSMKAEEEIIRRIPLITPKDSFVMVTDYDETGNGVCTPRIIKTACEAGIMSFGTSRQRIFDFRHFDFLLMNERDLDEGIKIKWGKFSETDLESKVKALLHETQSRIAIVTQKEKGVSLFKIVNNSLKKMVVETRQVEGQINPCGAGDTFAAIFAISIAGGLNLSQAARLGVAGARSVVKKLFETGYPDWYEIETEYKNIFMEPLDQVFIGKSF